MLLSGKMAFPGKTSEQKKFLICKFNTNLNFNASDLAKDFI